MNELTPRAQQYLRTLRLVELRPADPAGLRLAKTAPPSTAEELELECALVEAVMCKMIITAKADNAEAVRVFAQRGRRARDMLAAAGEQHDVDQALAAWENAGLTEQVMRGLTAGNAITDVLERARKGTAS